VNDLDFEGWSCPLPLRNTPQVLMGHGGGGVLSAELIENIFLPSYGSSAPSSASASASVPPVSEAGLGDSAVLPAPGGRLAFSTDSYVVKPMFFPGGCIGDLAVNGTVNDLAMMGARPLYLSAGFIIAEGTEMSTLGRIASAMGAAASLAGVQIVTGDTKVVDHGSGDGVYINTAGVGVIADGVEIGPARARPGDVVLINGDIGVHGIAVMSCREGLEFGTSVSSDSAAVHELVSLLLEADVDVRVLRDPTRGGVSATTNEIAKASGVGIDLVERDLPIPESVRDACGLLGLDPLQVANEGKVIAIVAADDAERALELWRSHPLGAGACRIGTVVAEHAGMVVSRTGLGGTRVIDLPIGEQLPRIC
jgi:hydrogenase expression/formation protein HypE